MVVIGVDSHKQTHTVVAVDEAGRKLAERTAATTADGHLELLGWSRTWPERTWALEDCRNLTRRLEADLLKAGEAVLRVPTKLMAGARRSAREPGKSDPIDALSVARAALREPNLPVARLDGSERELRLLVDYREVLISDRTGHQSRLRWFLVELGIPEPPSRRLALPVVLAGVDLQLVGRTEPCARIARDLIARISEMTRAIDDLGRQIGELTETLAPSLMGLFGCGSLTAASSSPRPLASVASALVRPMHLIPGRPRYQSGRATSSVIGSAAVATVSSTPPYTGSRSPSSAVRVSDRLMLPSAWLRATPRPRRSGPCVDVSVTRSIADYKLTRLPEPPPRALRASLLDTGGMRRIWSGSSDLSTAGPAPPGSKTSDLVTTRTD
jgi:transposase